MTTLPELISLCERAEGPSRKLDADIWAHLHPELFRTSVVGRFVNDKRYVRSAKDYIIGGITSTAPFMTASVDAAIALAERVLPGWRIENLCEWDHERLRAQGPWMCDLVERGKDFTAGTSVKCAHAPTPAIALVLAVLRALSNLRTTP